MKSKLERINKKELTQAVSKKTGIKQADTAVVIDGLLEEIIKQFQANNMIELRGFGTFYPYFRKTRTYTIPRLKEKRDIKGRLTIRFKPSKQIQVMSKNSERTDNG